ncbi:N-lysine methyltransferase SETD6 [Pelomyxa schiedti]|nr:N-lysine methyltransferase SETD6 [Pelomyxa schiedti]
MVPPSMIHISMAQSDLVPCPTLTPSPPLIHSPYPYPSPPKGLRPEPFRCGARIQLHHFQRVWHLCVVDLRTFSLANDGCPRLVDGAACHFDSGTRVVASEGIAAQSCDGETAEENEGGCNIFTVPVDCLLGPLNCTASVAVKSLGDGLRLLAKEDANVALVTCMMCEATLCNSSKWKPFLDILPVNYSTPYFWSDGELEYLSGTDVVESMDVRNLKKTFTNSVQPIIDKHPDCFTASHTFQDFLKWGSCVTSRSFSAHPTYSGPVMVPMADMLNHKTGFCNAHLENHSCEDRLFMVLQKDVAPGEEIFNTYGDLSNSELLRCYGFVDTPNSFDKVSIDLNWLCTTPCLSSFTSEASTRTKWLQNMLPTDCSGMHFCWTNQTKQYTVYNSCPEMQTPAPTLPERRTRHSRASKLLVDIACVICMDVLQFSILRSLWRKGEFKYIPAELKASQQVHEFLCLVARTKLETYGGTPASLQHTLTTLKAQYSAAVHAGNSTSAEHFTRLSNAVIVRIGETAILEAFLAV